MPIKRCTVVGVKLDSCWFHGRKVVMKFAASISNEYFPNPDEFLSRWFFLFFPFGGICCRSLEGSPWFVRTTLGGGFKCIIFTPYLGKMSNLITTYNLYIYIYIQCIYIYTIFFRWVETTNQNSFDGDWFYFKGWKLGVKIACPFWEDKEDYTSVKWHGNGQSPCLVGYIFTYTNGCFPTVMLVFGGVIMFTSLRILRPWFMLFGKVIRWIHIKD